MELREFYCRRAVVHYRFPFWTDELKIDVGLHEARSYVQR